MVIIDRVYYPFYILDFLIIDNLIYCFLNLLPNFVVTNIQNSSNGKFYVECYH